MKQRTRKLLTLLLIAAMVMSLMVPALAADTAQSETLSDNAGTQIGYLFIGVTYYLHRFEPVCLALFREIRKKQLSDIIKLRVLLPESLMFSTSPQS